MPHSRLKHVDWSVYVILDPARMHDAFDLQEMAIEALEGGASVLQLRDKRSSDRTLFERARAVADVCEAHDAIFVVNDRPDVALASGSDGVHLGPRDLPIDAVREMAPDFVIGGSAGTIERAQALEAAGADYLGSGAIYDAGPSKPDASEPRGPEAIRSITEAVSIPVVGIGGIRHYNAAPVIEAGAQGVAVIREVVSHAHPREATRRLVETVEAASS